MKREEQDHYNKSVNKFVVAATIFFALSVASGYQMAVFNPEASKEIIERAFSDGLGFLRDLNPVMLAIGIFLNNAIKTFIAMVLGILFGIIPLLFIFSNGFMLGLVIGTFVFEKKGVIALAGIIPHGILEIPAMLLSAGYGVWLGFSLYRKLRYHDAVRIKFNFAIKYFVRVILPLLLVAAIVETFITPLVISFFR